MFLAHSCIIDLPAYAVFLGCSRSFFYFLLDCLRLVPLPLTIVVDPLFFGIAALTIAKEIEGLYGPRQFEMHASLGKHAALAPRGFFAASLMQPLRNLVASAVLAKMPTT